MIYSILMTGVILIVLIYSSWIDVKRREIPIELYLLLVLPMGIVGQVLKSGPDLFEAVSMTVIVGICYLILALCFQGGGGDLIMMVALAVCLGYGMILVMTISTVGLIVVNLIKQKGMDTPIPYAPFVLLGVTVERVIYYLNI